MAYLLNIHNKNGLTTEAPPLTRARTARHRQIADPYRVRLPSSTQKCSIAVLGLPDANNFVHVALHPSLTSPGSTRLKPKTALLRFSARHRIDAGKCVGTKQLPPIAPGKACLGYSASMTFKGYALYYTKWPRVIAQRAEGER